MNEEQERMLTAWNDPPASQAEEIAEARLWAAEQKHTPGPWDYRKLPSGAYIVFHTYDKPTAGFIYQEPNARLIAAAPEMLEALKVCAAHIGNMPHPDFVNGGPIDIVYAQALQAIAKAEGRQADREDTTP